MSKATESPAREQSRLDDGCRAEHSPGSNPRCDMAPASVDESAQASRTRLLSDIMWADIPTCLPLSEYEALRDHLWERGWRR